MGRGKLKRGADKDGLMCSVCGSDELYALERCQPCYRYWRRNGIERPSHLWGRVRESGVLCDCQQAPIVSRITATIRTDDRRRQVGIGVCAGCLSIEQEEIRSLRR
jgi:hypothetical protein